MAATNPLETSERAAATGPDALASVAHRPWHRGDYIARLCSFRSRWWMGKPHSINPAICSLHGWRNTGPDTLRCDACGAILVATMAASWGGAEADVAAQRYAARLVDAHNEGCMWKSVSPPSSIARQSAADEQRQRRRKAALDSGAAEWWAVAAEMALFPAPAAKVSLGNGFKPAPSDGRTILLPSLLQEFRERYHALSRVERLPRVSDACIENMDRLMGEPPSSSSDAGTRAETGLVSRLVRQEDGRVKEAMKSIVGGIAVPVGDELAYSRSRVLLAACGWMPRLMPFTVSPGKVATSATSGLVVHPLEAGAARTDAGDGKDPSTLSTSAKADAGTAMSAKWSPSSVVLECESCGAKVPLWMTALGRDSRLVGLDTVLSSPPTASSGQDDSIGRSEPNKKRLRVDVTSPSRSSEHGRINLFGSIAGGPSPIAPRERQRRGSGDPDDGGAPASLDMPFGKGAAACTPVMRPMGKRTWDDMVMEDGGSNGAGGETLAGDSRQSQRNDAARTTNGLPTAVPSQLRSDILALHRPYCQWVCSPSDVFPKTEKALLKRFEGRKCGWQLVVSALMGNESP